MFSWSQVTLITSEDRDIETAMRFLLLQQQILGTTSQSMELHIFNQLVCSVCSLHISRAADKNIWGRAALCTWDSNAEMWKSLHSSVQTCIKVYWILCVHRRGLAGSALHTELRFQVRSKSVKQINPKGQKKTCLDTNSVKVMVK